MESTRKIGIDGISKKRAAEVAALVVMTAVLSHGPLLGASFVTGVSFIAYMLSKSTFNIYLAVPAAASLLPYISKGTDSWGYIAAIMLCALVFAAARNISLKLWQRGIIAASADIISISIYSMLSRQVYMISPESLVLDGMLIIIEIYIFDAFYSVMQSADYRYSGAANHCQSEAEHCVSAADYRHSAAGYNRRETHYHQNAGDYYSGAANHYSSAANHLQGKLPLASFTIISLMFINGLGFTFAVWMCIVFITLWVLRCLDAGDALLTAAVGGITAAVMGQAQWGMMTTLMIGILAGAYVKKYGSLLMTTVFAVVCLLCGAVESGVVLGIDKYCLLLPSAAFFALTLKFGAGMRRIIYKFAGRQEEAEESTGRYAENILKDKVSQMNDLMELYSTYFDSRAMLANQFDMTRQILDDVRWRLSRQGRKAAAGESCGFDVDVAVSQCAATGLINGDCCGWQDIGCGKFAMVVSDGMGKGKKAASESLMVTRTMIALLSAGVTADAALRMVNTIMLTKEDEDSYATLDMVTVDRHSCKARFYKIGAAPTLIRRRSNVEEVRLSAVPLGIVNGLKIQYVETTLKKGDWIIMMSDGVSDGGSRADSTSQSTAGKFLECIKETAADVRSEDPQTMCDLIINRAADSYIGRERDDLTVVVARIV